MSFRDMQEPAKCGFFHFHSCVEKKGYMGMPHAKPVLPGISASTHAAVRVFSNYGLSLVVDCCQSGLCGGCRCNLPLRWSINDGQKRALLALCDGCVRLASGDKTGSVADGIARRALNKVA